MSAQSMQALARANQIRLDGMHWRQRVGSKDKAAGRVMLARTLERNNYRPEIGALRLSRFLTAAPRIGPGKAREIVTRAGIYRHDPRIRELTRRERMALAAELRRRAEGRP